jgi:hypothetical protein
MNMRDLMTLCENEQPYDWLYHGTRRENLTGIAQQGLVPQKPDGHWPEYDDAGDWSFDGDDDAEEEEVELPPEAFEPRTFFTVSQSLANDYSGGGVVLRVPDNCASFEKGETDFPYYYTTERIDPSLIQVWTGTTWVPVQEMLP